MRSLRSAAAAIAIDTANAGSAKREKQKLAFCKTLAHSVFKQGRVNSFGELNLKRGVTGACNDIQIGLEG